MRRLDSALATAYYKWMAYIFLASMWGITIKDFAEGNQRIAPMYYILPPCTFLLLWFFSRFKQVTLDGATLIIRSSSREARIPTSQIKRVYKRNGKMPYISIVFKSETEFGRCVRILNMDVDKIEILLRAAMEGKDIGVKIHRISDESERPLHQNHKEVIVSGWADDELSSILTDFADMNSGRFGEKFDYAICPHDKGATCITFPHGIPAEQFSFLVNYLNYPKNFDLKTRSILVVGSVILSKDFHPPDKSLIGKKATFYVPSDDKDYDLVYVRIGDETFKNSFASRNWKLADDARIPVGINF